MGEDVAFAPTGEVEFRPRRKKIETGLRELHAAFALLALGVPLVAEYSLAVDRRYVPLGAPLYLATTFPLSEEPLSRMPRHCASAHGRLRNWRRMGIAWPWFMAAAVRSRAC